MFPFSRIPDFQKWVSDLAGRYNFRIEYLDASELVLISLSFGFIFRIDRDGA